MTVRRQTKREKQKITRRTQVIEQPIIEPEPEIKPDTRTYRELQAAAKLLDIPAKGTKADLLERVLEAE